MAKFQKGNKRPENAGRKKGTPNKTTDQAREAIALLIESRIDQLPQWLDEIREQDGAQAAFKCLTSLLEYYIPKLNRAEITSACNQPPVVFIDNVPKMTLEEAARAYQESLKGL
ncbi:MAG: hypothetical protein WC989_01540 [Micavibrio sp.]